MPSIHSNGATTFAAVGTVSTATISSASLDNAAQRKRERDGEFGVPNQVTGYENGIMSSFQTSSYSGCSFLMAVYESREKVS
ncbi:hypothetical protein TNCV_4540481 [Trichonephila clavipes]|nr:hypothetical protein TNCV_4540481 [Trichonephila clavipes]